MVEGALALELLCVQGEEIGTLLRFAECFHAILPDLQ